jgi:hypothetical protein
MTVLVRDLGCGDIGRRSYRGCSGLDLRAVASPSGTWFLFGRFTPHLRAGLMNGVAVATCAGG